jgi:ABC-type branched-subunit amino acid transport system substrate-binding protein
VVRALHAAVLALVVSFVFTGACSAPRGPDIGQLPQLTSNDPRAEAELRAAQGSVQRGRSAQAEKQFRAFLHAHPEDALVPVAQLALGRLLLARHQEGEARALFASVGEHPDAAVAEQGRFYAGVTDERLGRHAAAVETLKPMLGRTIEPEQTALLLDTLTDAYVALNRYADAIRVLSMKLGENLATADRQAATARMADLIDHKVSPADVHGLLNDLDRKNPAFRPVVVRAVRDADAAHDTGTVLEMIDILRSQQAPLEPELTAIALRSQNSGAANPNAVGAILSLSGRARRVGEFALRGLMQAAQLPNEGPAAPDAPNVIFRDDTGDAARAVQAVEELANVHRVIAIIGPMDGQIAAAAGKRAQELSVPLIALSPAGNAPSSGEYVFRYFPTPDAEAKALAMAAKARGVESFAVLYPNSAYGQTMSAAFAREASARGLHQATSLPYAPDAKSFGGETAALAKARFDALFVPDSADHLALIAPALAAAGLWSTAGGERLPNGARAIVVLAPSVAYHANLPRLAGRYLQGASFAVPFDANKTQGASHDFVAQFQQRYGAAPDAFAAYAYDAYRLVRARVEAGAVTREALAAQLRQPHGPVTGLVAAGQGFDAAREALLPVQVLELRGAEFVPAQP